MNKIKVLIVYHTVYKKIALTDLIFCFKGHPDTLYYYYSIERGEIPNYLLRVDFDLIIFHMDFISRRRFEGFKEKVYSLVHRLKSYNAIKITLPQDEWIHTNNLNHFINEFNIDIVYTVAPESEFTKIYNTVNFNKTKFFKVLTGYISDSTLKKINKINKTIKERNIDIGYRAQAVIWLGTIGNLKGKIGDVFNLHAPRFNLTTNISTKLEDTLVSDSWLKFLLDCKYVIGVESGANLLDPDGRIWEKCEIYKREHPDATFEEYENACYPGMDGNLKLFALSPRHLEAAITKTCQVLIEGDYSGVLKPGLHYIELKKDFSNLDEVLQTIKDDKIRDKIIARTYTDIVASEKYSYRNFVNYIISTSMQGKTLKGSGLYAFSIFVINRVAEWQLHLKNKKDISFFRHSKYHIRSFPYTVLIKLGMNSFKEKRESIRY